MNRALRIARPREAGPWESRRRAPTPRKSPPLWMHCSSAGAHPPVKVAYDMCQESESSLSEDSFFGLRVIQVWKNSEVAKNAPTASPTTAG